jgi:hypothetical protein
MKHRLSTTIYISLFGSYQYMFWILHCSFVKILDPKSLDPIIDPNIFLCANLNKLIKMMIQSIYPCISIAEY